MDEITTNHYTAWFQNVIGAIVSGSRPAMSGLFLRVSGPESRGVTLLGNDFTRVRTAYEVNGSPADAVRATGNTERIGR